MARRKYIKDYRLIETVDERGRIHTETEYVGARYVYAGGAEAVRRERRRGLGVCAGGWLAYVGALIPDSAGMRAVYVALPFLFSALALGILTDTLLSAPRDEPFERRPADRMENRYPPAALWTAVLAGVSLLGELVRLCLGGAANGGDAVFCLCAAVLAGCGAGAYARRGRFACREDDG